MATAAGLLWRRGSLSTFRPASCLPVSFLLYFLCIAATPAYAQLPCGGAELQAELTKALFAAATQPDLNQDTSLSAADVVAAQVLGDPPACPGAASVDWYVENRTGRPTVDVQLSGERVSCLCRDDALNDSFRASATCAGEADGRCASIAGLAPGVWRLEFVVEDPDTGQIQRRRDLLVAGAAPTRSAWTAFASVLLVDRTANTGNGTLRFALATVGEMPPPALIRFDDGVFPAATPTSIPLQFSLPTLAADEVTIDALDADGLPWMRIIDAGGLPIGALSISGSRNHILGLALRNSGDNNRDVLNISGNRADGNRLERVRVETALSGDAIGIDDAAGKSFGPTANVVRDCEIHAANDKGIKVTTGAHARIENSLVGDNLNGGIQATLGGHAWVVDSVVAANGGGSGQNGLAVQGLDDELGFSSMHVEGTLLRDNLGNGVSARGFAVVLGENNVFVGNRLAGLRAFSDVAEQPAAVLEGSALVCNGETGAEVSEQARVDLGGGPFDSAGVNAFAFNGLLEGRFNFENASDRTVSALLSQWEHCGTAATCDGESIAAADLGDHGLQTRFEPALAHRGAVAVEVTEVRPLRAEAGQWVRIFGSGFNVVDTYEGQCGATQLGETCNPLRGTCVRVDGRPVPIEGLTPTMILLRWPTTCLGAANLTVTVQTASGARSSQPVPVCRAAR